MIVESMAAEIEDFVRSRNAVSPDDPGFGRDVDLFDCGYIDSVGLAELLSYIGMRFAVQIDDAEILSEDFSTIQGMARIVCCRRSQADQ